MQGIDTAGKVAYIGTFSRSIAPSVRIAYLVLPPALLQRYQTLCSHYSPTVSRFEQHTLFQFMKGGHFERNINRNRNTYRKKKRRFCFRLKKPLLLQTKSQLWEPMQVCIFTSGAKRNV